MDDFLRPYKPEISDISMPRNYDFADYQYECIMENIAEFEEDLDDEHEIALKLTHVGQAITLIVTDIGYHNPSLLYYYGFVNDQKATLIQHVSQINFLLVSVPKQEPDKPPRRIGFR